MNREKIKTFIVVMANFISVLFMEIEYGKAIIKKSMTISTWVTIFFTIIWIGIYIYLCSEIDIKE